MQKFDRFEDLVAFLRGWMSFGDPQVYDFVGMMHLFLACLDNLKSRALPGELEEVARFFNAEQREFLQSLAAFAALPYEEEDEDSE